MDGSLTFHLKSFVSSIKSKLKLPNFSKAFSHKNWFLPRDYSNSYIPLIDFNSDEMFSMDSAREIVIEKRNIDFLLNSNAFQILENDKKKSSQSKTSGKYRSLTCSESNSQEKQTNSYVPLEVLERHTGNLSNDDNEIKDKKIEMSQKKRLSSMSLNENDKKISNEVTSDTLRALTNYENNSQACSYIPLVEFRSDKVKSLNSIQEIKGNLNNVSFLFDSSGDNVDSELLYSATNISPKVNKNHSTVTKTSKKFAGASSDRGFIAINGFLQSLYCPKQSKVTVKKWKPDEYRYAKHDIYANIKYSYRRCLIIWGNLHDVESDFLYTLLKKSSPAFFHDRWIHGDTLYSKNKWGGVVAVYPNRHMAKVAAKELPLQHKFLKTLELSKLIYCLVRSELKYFTGGRTQVTINAKISGRDDLQKMEAMVHRFGGIESYICHHVIRNVAVVFEVDYARATYAFVAKTVLDGLPFGSGLLDVEIKVTPREKAILEDLPFQLKKFMGNETFPF